MPLQCSQCGASAADEVHPELTTSPLTLARLDELASTNEQPREADLRAIRPIVALTGAQLAKVDEEISRLKGRLGALEAERAALSKYHARGRGVVSPLRQMPPELLGEVFAHAAPPPAPRLVPDVHSPPWVLTHVCRAWRAVALSTPSLWSVITLDFTAQRRYAQQQIEAQIDRARALKVRFWGAERGDRRAQVQLLVLLLDVAHRWVHLEIRLASHLVAPLMHHAGALTELRRAHVSWDTMRSQVQSLDSVDFLRMAVKLVDVQVYSQFRFLPTQLPVLALDNVTRYDLDAPWSCHRDMLRSLPNLVEVSIRHGFDDVALAAEEPVHLKRVRRLHVTRPATLDLLCAPNVQELGTWGGENDGDAICGHLDRFLTRSSCSPRALALRGIFIEAMTAILAKYPCFRQASVLDADFVDNQQLLHDLLALVLRPDSPPLLPHITTVGLALGQVGLATQQLFLTMLESRWNASCCALRAAELVSHYPPDLGPETVARMEGLRAAGLRASIWWGQEGQERLGRWLLAARCI